MENPELMAGIPLLLLGGLGLLIAFSLLAIVGFQNIPYLMIVGGLLLFWVAWRMWKDLKAHEPVTVLDPVAGEHAAEVEQYCLDGSRHGATPG